MRKSARLVAMAWLLPHACLAIQLGHATESYKHQEMLACQQSVQQLADSLAHIDATSQAQGQQLERVQRLHASAKLRLRFAKYDSCLRKAMQAQSLLEPLLRYRQLAQPAQNPLNH